MSKIKIIIPDTLDYFEDIPSMEFRQFEHPRPQVKYAKIDGFNRPKSEQYWRRIEIPKRFKYMMQEYQSKAKLSEGKFDARAELIKELKINKKKYTEEWAHIELMWNYRWNGYSFMNNGECVTVSGTHFLYMNDWKMPNGYPDFRYIDMKAFWFYHFADLDPTCYGVVEVGGRQFGKTYKGGVQCFDRTTKYSGSFSAIQSKTETDAQSLFKKAIMNPVKKLPIYFQPEINSSFESNKLLSFYKSSGRGKDAMDKMSFGEYDELGSQIEVRSSGVLAFDGESIHGFYFGDEGGKLVDVDPYERWLTVRKCMVFMDEILGFAYHPTTVELMDKFGGKAFKKMWDDSNYDQRDSETGQTKSGLWRIFTPAYMSLNFDRKYGYSKEVENKKKILSMRKALENNSNKYTQEIRKMPFNPREAFMVATADCQFDQKIIQDRLINLDSFRIVARYGEYRWKDGKIGGITGMKIGDNNTVFNYDFKVEWVDMEWDGKNEDNKPPFTTYWMFPDTEKEANKWKVENHQIVPYNADNFCAGADPFKYKTTKGKRQSMGAGCMFRKHDYAVDSPLRDRSEWETYNGIVDYEYRRATSDEYCEDMLMMCIYHGAKMNCEIDIAVVWDYFERRGFGGYLFYKYDERKGAISTTPGDRSSQPIKEEIFRLTAEHIKLDGHRIKSKRYLEQCLDIESPEYMTDYDLFTAYGYALMGSKKQFIYTIPNEPIVVTNYFPEFFYDKNGNKIPKGKAR